MRFLALSISRSTSSKFISPVYATFFVSLASQAEFDWKEHRLTRQSHKAATECGFPHQFPIFLVLQILIAFYQILFESNAVDRRLSVGRSWVGWPATKSDLVLRGAGVCAPAIVSDGHLLCGFNRWLQDKN